tara:strand:- start:3236 stop:5005 length:1770 start_codon:yes stop_codon:yes gene_type:complete
MDQQKILIVENLSKKFFLNPVLARKPGAWQLLKLMLGVSKETTDLSSNEFWALKDVSFDLFRGEAIGIMGMNGAGKSTLLKVLLGRLSPDSGRYQISGSVGGLVELGAGFHSEMTGVENVYNKARLLGIAKTDVNSKLDEIVEFADLGDFIHSPVKTYSSGMNIRLGFSIAIHFVDDLILCDEILAVGDFDFRQKCLAKINELRNYKSFVLVSHNTRDISTFCSKALLLHKGEVVARGEPESVIEAYAQCSHHISASEVRRRIEASVRVRDRTETCRESVNLVRRQLFYENLDFGDELKLWILSRGNGEAAIKKDMLAYQGSKGTFTLRQELDRLCDTRFEFDLSVNSGTLDFIITDGTKNQTIETWKKGFKDKVIIEAASKFLWFHSKDLESQPEGLDFSIKNLKVKHDVKLQGDPKEKKAHPELTYDSQLSLFGPEYHRKEIIGNVSVYWNLRRRESGLYYVSGDVFGLKIRYELKRSIDSLRIGIPFFRLNGEMIIGPDSRNNPLKDSLRKKGLHEIEMVVDPLPVNDGRLWMTVTLCEDPAHLYRKHMGYFDIINPAQEYGTVKTFPVWGKNMNLKNLTKLTSKR